MFKELQLIQGSPEWLAKRLDYFPASHAGVIDNVYPYKTALQLATELLTKTYMDDGKDKSFVFAKGHAVEKAGRDWVLQHMGLNMVPAVIVSEKIPFLLASLDGKAEGMTFEAKYVGRDALSDVQKGIIKPHHYYQIQAQLLATGYEKCIYFAMDPDGNAAVMDVHSDLDMQYRLTDGLTNFWSELQAGRLPDPCDRDVLTVEDPQLTMLAQLDAKLSMMKKEYDSLEEIILARYADKPRVQGGGVSITRYWAKGNVDYAKIPNLSGVDLERFRKAGSMRTKVTVKKGA